MGLSIRDAIGNGSDDYFVALDDKLVPLESWAGVRPLAAQTLIIVPSPGNDNVKTLLVTAGLIAAAIFGGPAGIAAGFAGQASALGFASAGVLGSTAFWTATILGGSALLMASLTKPPAVNGEPAPKSLQTISSVSNRFAHYEPVPVIFGRRKVYPPYAAQPYTEIVGDDQYLNALFALGIGEHDIESARIGETLLTNYQGVTLEKTTAPVWVDISEQSLSTQLEDPDDPTGSPTTTATFTTPPGTETISVDFMLPAGLIYVQDRGESQTAYIDFRVEFRAVGSSGAWTNVLNVVGTDPGYLGYDPTWIEWTYGFNNVAGVPGLAHESYVGPLSASPTPGLFRVSGRKRDAIRFGLKWEAGSNGQWDVRVTRVVFGQPGGDFNGTDREFDKYLQTFLWTKLRAHNVDEEAVRTDGKVEFLKLRIKADDQLNGALDQFSVIATRRLRKRSGSNWTAIEQTRTPAWAYLDVLTGAANARPITDGEASQRIWLNDFVTWAAATDAEEFYFDDVIEQRTSVFQMLQLIASAGRADRSMRDTKHTIVREEDSQTPTQVFTTRNSRGYRFERKFFDPPHGFQIRFPSEEADYQEDEIIVYDDGYSESNATRFETLVFKGITNPEQIWRFGRFHIAQSRLRQKLHHIEVDFEHLASLRGDLVHVQNDVMLAAIGAARITRIAGNMLEVDEAFVVETGKSYAGKFRLIDHAGPSIEIVNHALSAPIGVAVRTLTVIGTIDPRIKVGDLMIFGESATLTVPLKITRIDPRRGLSAELTLVDHAPAILEADEGEIPPYAPIITVPPDPERVIPPAPRIVSIRSEQNQSVILPSGEYALRMIVAYDLGAYAGLPQDQVEMRVRVVQDYGEQPWILFPRQGVRAGSIATADVEPGLQYDVQIRVLTALGVPSPWSTSQYHSEVDYIDQEWDVYRNGVKVDPADTALMSTTIQWRQGGQNGRIVRFLAGNVRLVAKKARIYDAAKLYRCQLGFRRAGAFGNDQIYAGFFSLGVNGEIHEGGTLATGTPTWAILDNFDSGNIFGTSWLRALAWIGSSYASAQGTGAGGASAPAQYLNNVNVHPALPVAMRNDASGNPPVYILPVIQVISSVNQEIDDLRIDLVRTDPLEPSLLDSSLSTADDSEFWTAYPLNAPPFCQLLIGGSPDGSNVLRWTGVNSSISQQPARARHPIKITGNTVTVVFDYRVVDNAANLQATSAIRFTLVGLKAGSVIRRRHVATATASVNASAAMSSLTTNGSWNRATVTFSNVYTTYFPDGDGFLLEAVPVGVSGTENFDVYIDHPRVLQS